MGLIDFAACIGITVLTMSFILWLSGLVLCVIVRLL